MFRCIPGFILLVFSFSIVDVFTLEEVEIDPKEYCEGRAEAEYFRKKLPPDANEIEANRTCGTYYRCIFAALGTQDMIKRFECQSGKFFNVERQRCDSRRRVRNCLQHEKIRDELSSPSPLRIDCYNYNYLDCQDGSAFGERVKRQAENRDEEDEAESFLKKLCSDKVPDEWFRLELKDCRDVYQCVVGGLQALRCPHGLAFDLDQQTCDWKANVKNCNIKVKEKKVKPLLYTNEPVCATDQELACGDGVCMQRLLFCDGEPDCADGSDETTCDIDGDPNAAPRCDDDHCKLPDCFCYSNKYKTPGNIEPANVPQMIMISFDDAVNNVNTDLYDHIFDGTRVNPNGCTIKATFFVSHKYTNYTAVQELYRLGHEIAAHSISHSDSEKFWTEATKEEWTQEMAGGREIIENMANIPNGTIFGVRAPYLRVGGNNQFAMMEENGFIYDSTITAPLQNPPLWPYMLYYRMPHSCHGFGQKCPTRSYGIWEVVMNEMDRREDPNIPEDLPGCSMIDSCFTNPPTPDQFYNFLVHNFERHYLTNRAPLGLFFHSALLKNNEELLTTFLEWVDETLATNPEVYFVTMTQTLIWMTDPQDLSEISNYEAWKDACVPEGESFCGATGENNCELNTDELPGETIRLPTCMACPNKYPWLNDPQGLGRRGF